MIGTDFDPEHFERVGGNFMSLTFYRDFLKRLETIEPFKTLTAWEAEWTGRVVSAVKGARPMIHDYGCAEGDGTALLQIQFPMGKVVGYDLSEKAVERARERWPLIEFNVGDICDPKEEALVIFSSHTIEHTDDPYEVACNLRRFCRVLVLLFPTIDDLHDGGHKGAVKTLDWTNRFRKEYECNVAGWSSLRWDYEYNEPLVEGQNAIICQGEL